MKIYKKIGKVNIFSVDNERFGFYNKENDGKIPKVKPE